jgi:predicted nucleic acid-binding protein
MILLDTNILVRWVDPADTKNALVIATVQHYANQNVILSYTPQSAYEFWATATRPQTANGLGQTPDTTRKQLHIFQELFQFLPDRPHLYQEWETLVTTYACHGRVAFDARLVAAMRTHGITQILTFNGQDFTRFPGITILEPAP